MKDKIRVAIMTLLVILLLAMAGGFWIFVGKQAQEEKAREESLAIKAMYVEIGSHGDYLFIQQDKGSERAFTSEIPEDQLYELEDGKEKVLSADKLVTGDVLKIYGEGAMLKSEPGQYPGVTRMVRLLRGEPEDAEKYQEMLEAFRPRPIYDEEEGILAP